MAIENSKLDTIIRESAEQVKMSSNYNEILLSKLHNEELSNNKFNLNLFDKTLGYSFVLSGAFLIAINFFGLSTQITEIINKLKALTYFI